VVGLSVLVKQPRARGAENTLELVRDTVRNWASDAARAREAVLAIVAPTGWGEIRLRALNLDVLFSFRTFAFAYGLLLALVPLLISAAAVLHLGDQSAAMSVVLRTLVSLESFFLASCLSVGLLLTAALFALARFVGVVSWRPRYGKGVQLLAAASGVGTTFGAFVGSLVPVVGMLLSTNDTPAEGVTAFDGMQPLLLLELSGAGAIVGFILGQMMFPLTFSENATNLVYRSVLGPGVFALVMAVVARLGASPSEMLQRTAAVFRPSVDSVSPGMTDDQASSLLAQDWRSVVVYLADYGTTSFLDARGLTVSVIVVSLGVAGWTIARDFRAGKTSVPRELAPESVTRGGRSPR
jgi:hypothetical protein